MGFGTSWELNFRRNLKILFVFRNLGYCGGERIGLMLANYLASIYKVHIYTLDEFNLIGALLNDHITVVKDPDPEYDIEIATCEFLQKDFLLKRNNSAKKILLVQTVQWNNYPKDFSKEFYESLNNFDKLVFVSKYQHDLFVKKFEVKDLDKLTVNPITLNRDFILESAKESLDLDPAFWICNPGRIVNSKNLHETLEITKRLIDRGLNVRLMLLGSGIDLDQHVELVKQMRLDKRVLFIPFDVNPYKYISKCDLIISTSRSESFGLTMLEGILLNKIVVTNNQGAKMEVIQNGKLGIWYDNLSVVDKITKIILEDDLILRNNLLEFNNNYDSEEMFIKFKNIINEIS